MGRTRKYTARTLLLALCLLAFAAAALTGSALAYSRVDVGREGSLTLRCDYDGPLSGASFRLYRVGDMSETVRFTLSGDFAGCPVSLDGLDADGWRLAANTLATYADADPAIRPLAEGMTDETGTLAFGPLATGLYLAVGEDCEGGGVLYRTAPFLTCLPELIDGAWDYDAVLKPKAEPVPPQPPLRDLSVVKHWVGGASRPEKVTVTLLENGKDYETVELNAENFWRHTWEGLNGDSTWRVVERDVPPGYTVTYTGTEWVLTVTNTRRTPHDPDTPDTPDIPDEEVPETETPDTPGNPGEPTEDIPEEPVPLGPLPQTGQLWWPVPLLSVLGLVIFSAGWMETFRKRGRNGHA